MRKLGCIHAVNLDGGASATMWVMGTVVNNPSAGFDRLAANALVVLQKEPKPLD
jgi:exopolysaccharide biosynthesis protein